MQLHLDVNRKKKVPKITVRKTWLMKKFTFSKNKNWQVIIHSVHTQLGDGGLSKMRTGA